MRQSGYTVASGWSSPAKPEASLVRSRGRQMPWRPPWTPSGFCVEPWPDGLVVGVRMAVHTGEARLRDEGDYFGDSVLHCARLRSIGHGGQVLVAATTAALTADRLP